MSVSRRLPTTLHTSHGKRRRFTSPNTNVHFWQFYAGRNYAAYWSSQKQAVVTTKQLADQTGAIAHLVLSRRRPLLLLQKQSPATLGIALSSTNFLASSLFSRSDHLNTGRTYKPRLEGSQPKRNDAMSDKSDRDNHANQLNENNDAYWESRGYDERPDDWKDRSDEDR